ncbi:MAG TPA: FAD-dependent oxidoreductase [Gemmatimonadaceae bacterium]|nr:FAD-dependent oxidoreductase [Gemmatimonadaceae bacterium]
MTDTRPSAIVIGAGIVGAACAAALAERGVRVTVIEREYPACGTTAAGMGHLVAMDDSPAQLSLTARSLALWRSLAPDLPNTVELRSTGTLWIGEDDGQMAALRAKQATYRKAGIESEILDARQTREAEPRLREGIAGSLRVAGDSVLYPPTAALALLERAASHGARVMHATVDAIEAHAVRIGTHRLKADFIVKATGADGSLPPHLPIVPRKGHLAITDRQPGFCRHQVVETGYLASAHVMSAESVAFNVQPRATGQVLIGSSRELVGRDASLNRAVLARMLARAVAFMPALAGVSIVRTWIGFRPATEDKLPLIGWWPDVPGLLVAAGHEGLGITTATGTAEIIAALVTGGASDIDPAPFTPTRVMATA